jgi:hypothetical protein
VVDINAALQFEIIRNSGANRPAETDIARIRWWLGSGFVGPIAAGETFIDTTGAVDMDASDYRGRTGADLLQDCSGQSGKNYFVAWSDSANAPLVHYYQTTAAINSSTLKISNILSEVDESTVFAPDAAVRLNRDPSSVYTGIYLQYGTGVDFVYRTNSTTLAAVGHKRELSQLDSTVSSATQATAKADNLLTDSSTEFDKITVTLQKVPAAKVNLMRAGQRIQVKFSHLPGYTSDTWIRISRRTVQQDGETDAFYRLDLELSNSKVTRGVSKHGPPSTQTDDPPDATMCDHAACSVGSPTAAAYTEASGDSTFSFAGAAAYASSKLSPNTAYTVCGCALGCGGYGPGKFEQEIWYSIDVSAETSSDLGMMVTIGTSTGQGAAAGFVIGIGHGSPTGLGQWSGVGGVGLSGGTVFIPRSELSSSTTNWLVLAPAWHSGAGFLCADQLVSPCGGPLIGGEMGSGQATTPSVSAQWQYFCGSGRAPWVPPVEEVDGSTSTFTLIDWTGHGTPQARVGPLHMAEGSEYTVDRSAGTVTFKEAPPAYSQVAFRYMVQS